MVDDQPVSVDGQIDILKQQLDELENHASSQDLLARLAVAYPYHPARIARGLFVTLAAVTFFAMAVSLALPFAGPGAAELAAELERAMPLPVPLLLGVLSGCMAVAWFGASQAALSVARECPMMPWEAEARRKLLARIKALESERSELASFRRTPMAPQPRTIGTEGVDPQRLRGGTPRPSPGRGTPVSSYGGTELRRPAPNPAARVPQYEPPAAGRGTPLGSPLRSGGTPIGAAPRSPSRNATRPGLRSGRFAGTLPPSGLAETPSYAAPDGGTPSPARGNYLDEIEDVSGDEVSYLIDVAPQAAAPRGNDRYLPEFGDLPEPWLADAVERAVALSRGYPVQAHVEFNVEEELPFTLVLERTTPAMAIRLMVSYTDFLCKIATPPRGRIVLRAVAHLDRSFYRSVLTALEPHFPNTVEVIQRGAVVDITFLEPDSGWRRYPEIPTVL